MTIHNCGLLEHLILKFGDAKLKQEMNSFVREVDVFMKETTVCEAMKCFPGDVEHHLIYTKLKVQFNENPKVYTLERLCVFRRKLCRKVWQSELTFGLSMLEPGGSFVATWLIPTVVVSKLMEAALNHIDENFYQEESVTCVSLEAEESLVLYTQVNFNVLLILKLEHT